ncbi:MAG: hypothetical protein ABMA26_09120 [Limisphaerales bacterium]
MSKKDRRHQQRMLAAQSASTSSNNITPSAPSGPTTPQQAAEAITALGAQATNLITDDEVYHPPQPPSSPEPSEIDPVKLWQSAHEARDLFNRATARMNEAEAKVKQREAEIQESSAQVHKREEELRQQKEEQRKSQRELDDRKSALDRREREIVQTEEKLKEREIDAEAGFLQQRRQALAKLDEEAKSLAQQISEHHQTYLAGIKKYESELREIRDKELAGLEQGSQQLQSEKQEVARARREAEWAKQEADELKASWVARVEVKVREAVSDRESRLQSALARCEDLARQISRHEESERMAAGKTREQLLAELTASQERNANLASSLAQKPSDDQVAQLSGLQREKETLLSDLGRLRQENQSLQVQLGKLSIGVAEIQNLRDQKSAWESRERALRACVDELQRDLGELVDKSKAQRVFPSLIAMDDDSELQVPPEYPREKLPPLKELAKEIQDRIAGQKLFYGEKDIRAFLAGLATSRLHLLQGISGTGKTSLPLAFAKAIGAASALIEVQSGWRDRNDLLGYYNAFERRFYESEFLQALYRAQLPHHDSLPFFVVLDEMNLSHPEHYFADFLSALEQKPERQRISLLTAKVDGTPRLLEEGRWLRIPQNVWFIGTANHDETTKDFASKTYDRSHVMEFPRHPAAFSPKAYNRPMPITSKALEDAFAKAGHTRREDSARAKVFLEKSLSDKLAKLGLGWGNRLERQIDCFVPVIIESGGSLGEAADHLVATKLLRKLRGRFDLGSKQLGDFQDHLLNAWKEIDVNGFPEKCAELLTGEIKRLGGG